MNSFFSEALKKSEQKTKGEEILNLLRNLSNEKKDEKQLEQDYWSYEVPLDT